MNNINRTIAESLGYTVTKARSGYWALRLNGGGNIGNFVTENLAWDHAPDFEHDLNDAIELLEANGVPFSDLCYDAGAHYLLRWRCRFNAYHPTNEICCLGETPAIAICEAYCRLKGIAIPEE